MLFVVGVFRSVCYECKVCFLNETCCQWFGETSLFWDVWVSLSFGDELYSLVKSHVGNAHCEQFGKCGFSIILHNAC